MKRVLWTLLMAALLISILANRALADRRYFVQSYTPYLAPAGTLELEVHSIARSGQGDSTGTSWQNRIEFEYGISDRLTGAAYLNFVQPPGPETAAKFDGPSLEFIYRLAQPGRLPVDPAAYLEVRANGDEVEVEPKLLLARRIYRLVSVLNVIGEIEHVSAGEEAGTTEKNLEVTTGLSREIGHTAAIGLEGVYSRSFSEDGPDAWGVLLGPTLNLQATRAQITLGWQPQLVGRPKSTGGLNLNDFPRSEVRLIVGVDL